jgi:hypothetical protein
MKRSRRYETNRRADDRRHGNFDGSYTGCHYCDLCPVKRVGDEELVFAK